WLKPGSPSSPKNLANCAAASKPCFEAKTPHPPASNESGSRAALERRCLASETIKSVARFDLRLVAECGRRKKHMARGLKSLEFSGKRVCFLWLIFSRFTFA